MNIRKLRNRFYKKTGGPRGWGNRCKDYYAGCICCEAYKTYDQTGRFPNFDEAHEITKEINKGEVEKHDEWVKTEEGQKWVINSDRKWKVRSALYARQEAARDRRKTRRAARKKHDLPDQPRP